MNAIEYAKACLAGRFQDLSQRLTSIEYSRRRGHSPLSVDSEERAAERQNDEVLDRLASTTQLELAQVRHAIERINQGQYGSCEQCHERIHPQRLRAIPEATRCSPCSSAIQLAA